MNFMRIGISALLASALFVTACGKPNVTGQYVLAGDDGAVMLQLVQTPDQTLTGQINSAYIDKSGKVEQVQRLVTGVTDNGAITLATKANSFLEGQAGYTGRLSGNTLTLTGQSGTMALKKSSAATFEKALVSIQTKSEAILEERAAAKEKANAAAQRAGYYKNVGNAADWLADANKAIAYHLEHVPPATNRYAELSAKVAGMLQKARAETDSIERGQIAIDMRQETYEANQVKYAIDDVEREAASQSRFYESNNIKGGVADCKTSTALATEERAACTRLVSAAATFDQGIGKLQAILLDCRNAYATETKRMNSLIEQAIALH